VKLKVIQDVFLPVVFDLNDDSNNSEPEYREFAPFFANGYLEWPFEIKYPTCTGLIEICDKGSWEDDAKVIEYSLIEVEYLPKKISQDSDYPYVHSFKEIGRIPLNAIEDCKLSARFCEVDLNFIDPEPDDYLSETKTIKNRKKIL
jgi:hypothetical protein